MFFGLQQPQSMTVASASQSVGHYYATPSQMPPMEQSAQNKSLSLSEVEANESFNQDSSIISDQDASAGLNMNPRATEFVPNFKAPEDFMAEAQNATHSAAQA